MVDVSLSFLLSSIICVLLSVFLYMTRAKILPNHNGSSYSVRNLPYFGSLFSVLWNTTRFHDLIVQIAKEQGDGNSWVSGLPFSPPFLYLGADPESIEYMLKTNFNNFEKGQWFSHIMSVFLGQGIFNSDGDDWRRARKLASHTFTARSLKQDMSCVFLKNAHFVLSMFKQYAADKQVFDIQDLFFRFTLDSFSEIAFGHPIGCLSKKEAPFARAFDLIQSAVNLRFYEPFWKIKRLLNVGSERVIKEQIPILHAHAFDVIRKLRQDANKHSKPDLLSRFISYAETNNTTISDQELLDHTLNFIIAGRDTTGCLLSWAAYNLAKDQHLQQQVYEECKSFSSDAIHDSVTSLPLLHAVIMETLRLYPPVPHDTKECVAGDTFPNGMRIPPKTMVVFSPFLMGRSHKIWGPDADTFRPQRWLEPGFKEPDQFAFPVFNAGFRLCLGKQVAILESTVLMCMILSHFRLIPVDTDVTYSITVTLPIKNGLRVRVESR